MVLAGVLTDAGGAGVLQLRDSDGFAPFFPRFHQRLIPAETRQTNLGECTAIDLFRPRVGAATGVTTARHLLYGQA